MTFLPQKLLGLLLGAILPSVAAHAQSDFRAGYIIQTTGDTLRGRVDFSGGKRANQQCRFRPTEGASVATYTPEQLSGYGFSNDRTYQVQRVPKSNLKGDSTTQRVFLEVLVRGAVSLYMQLDSNAQEQFYARLGSGAAVPLVREVQTVVAANGQETQRERAVFRGVLAEYFGACPAVQSKVGGLVLKSSNLIALIQQYNQCLGATPSAAVVASPKRRYFVLGAIVGAQAGTLRFTGDTPVRDVRLSGGASPVVGIGAQLRSSASANRLTLRIEALYERQRYAQEYQTNRAFLYSAYQEVRIDLERVRVPMMLRYAPLNGRFLPFVEAGVSVAVALANTNEYRYRALPTSDYSPWATILPNARSVEQGWLAGVGVAVPLANRHGLTAGLRAERTNGFSDAVGIETEMNRYFFLLSYDLSKRN